MSKPRTHAARAAISAKGVTGSLGRSWLRDTLTDELRAELSRLEARSVALRIAIEGFEERARQNRVALREAKARRAAA